MSIRVEAVRVEGDRDHHHSTGKELPMRKVVVFNNLSLDGVMQAPGRSDEDLRGGCQHGGWAFSRMDSVMGEVAAEGMARQPDLLFGRRTYEDFFSFWPK